LNWYDLEDRCKDARLLMMYKIRVITQNYRTPNNFTKGKSKLISI
jgi:hypothetical protein